MPLALDREARERATPDRLVVAWTQGKSRKCSKNSSDGYADCIPRLACPHQCKRVTALRMPRLRRHASTHMSGASRERLGEHAARH